MLGISCVCVYSAHSTSSVYGKIYHQDFGHIYASHSSIRNEAIQIEN